MLILTDDLYVGIDPITALDRLIAEKPHLAQTTLSPETLAGWIADLRSGAFVQGFSTLTKRTSDSSCVHCCLGVLAQRIYKVSDAVNERHPERVIYEDPAGGGTVDLYQDYINRELLHSKLQHLLAEANDSRVVPFSLLADWIEANLKPAA